MNKVCIPIRITDTRPDFDRACRMAEAYAVKDFGIDEDGHSNKVTFNPPTDSIHIRFSEYECVKSMTGAEHVYEFHAWISREEKKG